MTEKQKEGMTKFTDMPLAFCPTCKHWKPPFAKHCNVAERDVIARDHFCPFIGNNVAYRNYKNFCMFLVFAFFIGIFALTTTCCELIPMYTSNPLTDIDYERCWANLQRHENE